MIHLRFLTADFDFDAERWQETVQADLIADGNRMEISGPNSDWIDLEMSVFDPETRTRLHREEDPERWARLLPGAFRGGDLEVSVIADSPTSSVEDHGILEAPRVMVAALAQRLPFGR
jgi:hypothetical protein